MRWVFGALVLAGCGRFGFGEVDAPRTDAGADAEVDAGDGATAVTACDAVDEPDLVALYSFESGLGDELTGRHPAMPRGGVVAAAGRCGAYSAAFPAGAYLLVPDAPAFDLATGSIELYVRTPDPSRAENQALISRDANGLASEGHLAILLSTSGQLVARLQRGGASYYRCHTELPADTWVHIGVSWGGAATEGFRLWVDHAQASLPSTMLDGAPITCTDAPPAGGIAGNGNTLVIGGSNVHAGDGSQEPVVDQFLVDGQLDQVRLRSSWRDFGLPE